MYATVKLIATIMSLSFFIDRLGRRKLLMISSIGTSLSLWYIGAFITARHINLSDSGQQKSAGGWVAIVSVYIYGVSPLIHTYYTHYICYKLECHLEID